MFKSNCSKNKFEITTGIDTNKQITGNQCLNNCISNDLHLQRNVKIQ
jgi:hypothetical protein